MRYILLSKFLLNTSSLLLPNNDIAHSFMWSWILKGFWKFYVQGQINLIKYNYFSFIYRRSYFLLKFHLFCRPVNRVRFVPNAKCSTQLVTFSQDKSMGLWDIADGKRILELNGEWPFYAAGFLSFKLGQIFQTAKKMSTLHFI